MRKINDESMIIFILDHTKFGIAGLHTCGDLGSALIKLYAKCEEAKALYSVACCHMRLTSTFPLSHYVSTFQRKEISKDAECLSYLSKELSCHAIETYVQRLNTQEQYSKLKVHCYRALLELLIHEKNPNLRHSALKSVTKCHLISFREYAEKATQGLNLTLDFNDSILLEKIDLHLSEWWNVVIYYSLRLLFAPLIETVILLDRCLYLLDEGHSSYLVPIFDPLLSPRNHVLMSVKNVETVIEEKKRKIL